MDRAAAVVPLLAASLLLGAAVALGEEEVRTGAAAFGDWSGDAPGVRRRIEARDLPAPGASRSAARQVRIVRRPQGTLPKVPPGFVASEFAAGLDEPRLVRTAPNGDVFLVESGAGRVRVLRPGADGARPEKSEVFAARLRQPFGIAFYPPGPDPRFAYVAENRAVRRFPYRAGDLQARGPAETVVADLPEGGHWTRDIAFSPDGRRMYVSVGSLSNDNEGGEDETRRAAILAYTPEGKDYREFASGIRNPVSLAVHPRTGDLWTAVNERDELGDDLPPDYVTRLREGGFYGWPWFYIGGNPDPRHKGAHAELRDRVALPDVLIQAHSAPLQMTFYDGAQFPPEYRGDAFAALHGSWNRAKLTGYKVIRVRLKDGAPTGEYEDFMTGFVTRDGEAWGRPVGVAVAKDGSLLVTEDGGGTMWRVAFRGEQH